MNPTHKHFYPLQQVTVNLLEISSTWILETKKYENIFICIFISSVYTVLGVCIGVCVCVAILLDVDADVVAALLLVFIGVVGCGGGDDEGIDDDGW